MLFNGAEGSLTGDNALTAKVGETVRLFVGNGGPNLVSSFHVIGEIFDKVRLRRRHALSQENVQTTLIPAGGAAIVEFHSSRCRAATCWSTTRSSARSTRARSAILKVDGPEDKDDLFRQGGRLGLPRRPAPAEPERGDASAAAARDAGTLTQGGADQGRQGAVHGHLLGLPPGERRRAAERVPAAGEVRLPRWPTEARRSTSCCNGLTGKVTVNGSDYNSVMPPMSQLNDDEVANILTFVLQQLGQPG